METYRLRDGSEVVVRPIQPDDKAKLSEGLSRLSEQSRYFRFLRPVPRFSSAELKYLTEVDHRDHEAWVVLDGADPAQRGLGVARYIRLKQEPTVAEAAVTVVDSHQGLGVGTLLLALLVRSALHNGIRHFRAYVHPSNRKMLGVFQDVGATFSHDDPMLVTADMELPEHPENYPQTPVGRVFRSLARKESSLHD